MESFRPLEVLMLQTCMGALIVIALIVAMMAIWARRSE